MERTCQFCGVTFRVKPAYVRNGAGKFCSYACTHAARRSGEAERFWSHVERTETCWLWRGARRWDGYGASWRNEKTIMAHRHAWILTNGPIPEGQIVMHRCDVRHCTRPDHLELGTHKRNSRDMVSRGRAKNKRTIITSEVARAIRRRYQEGGLSQQTVAQEFGVNSSTVSRIHTGRRWD